MSRPNGRWTLPRNNTTTATKEPAVNCIAHRGFAKAYPENTLMAVRQALDAGADGVEVDARRCGSGEPVVVHDETVDRVTDRSGAVSALSRSELADCSVLGTGEGVPTLDAVCEALPAEARLHLELKEVGVAADAVALTAGRPFDLLVSSFDAEALEAAADTADVPLAYLFGSGRDLPPDSQVQSAPDAALATARDLGCAAVNPHWSHCDAAFVERAHDAGFAVNAWTVQSRAVAEALAAAGVDGLIADAPGFCPGDTVGRDSFKP